MKKLVLSLLLLASSLFAVTTSQIMNADPAYARAYITQIDIRDSNEVATKLNTPTYPYLGAGYPYTNIEYSDSITSWYYTIDYNNLYPYSYPYSGFWDQYVNPNDLSTTYVYVYLQGYSKSQTTLYHSVNGQKSVVPTITHNGETFPKYLGNQVWVYCDLNSNAVNAYEVKTHIQASDGTVDLYNHISISRTAQ